MIVENMQHFIPCRTTVLAISRCAASFQNKMEYFTAFLLVLSLAYATARPSEDNPLYRQRRDFVSPFQFGTRNLRNFGTLVAVAPACSRLGFAWGGKHVAVAYQGNIYDYQGDGIAAANREANARGTYYWPRAGARDRRSGGVSCASHYDVLEFIKAYNVQYGGRYKLLSRSCQTFAEELGEFLTKPEFSPGSSYCHQTSV